MSPTGNPSDPVDPEHPPEDGPGHIIIITLNSDTNMVTGPTTVNYTATVPDGSQPSLSLSFFEAVPSASPGLMDYRAIAVSPAPTVNWNNGVGSFSVVMNSAIFSQFTENPTSFVVHAEIPNVESHGSKAISVDLP